MERDFTAVFRKVPEGFIGFVEELPGANAQGETLDATRESLENAGRDVLDANRELVEQDLAGMGDVIRERLHVSAA